VLVGGIVIHDQVQLKFSRCLLIDVLQEADEYLMPVLQHAVANDLAVERVQCGEQGGRAMAFVVMRAAAAGFQRQTRLRAVERLNLALFIHTEHQRFVGWVQVQADYVDEFLNELRVGLTLNVEMRCGFKPCPLPNASHRCFADALRLGHQSCAPVRGVRWLTVQRRLHNRGDLMVGNRRKATRTRRVFLQSFRAQGQKTFAPQLHGGPRDAKPLVRSPDSRRHRRPAE